MRGGSRCGSLNCCQHEWREDLAAKDAEIAGLDRHVDKLAEVAANYCAQIITKDAEIAKLTKQLRLKQAECDRAREATRALDAREKATRGAAVCKTCKGVGYKAVD